MRKFSNVETEKLIIHYLLNIYRLIFEKICKYKRSLPSRNLYSNCQYGTKLQKQLEIHRSVN